MEKICHICGNKFFIESLKSRKKYCSTECFNKYYSEYKKKYSKEYKKKKRIPGTKAYQKHLEYNREYLKKYNQLESTKEKKKHYELNSNRKEYIQQYQKKYRETPARKEYLKQYMKEYSKKPEVIEKRKEYLKKYISEYYRSEPPIKLRKTAEEIKDKKYQYLKEYNQRPEVIEKQKEYLKQYLKSDIGHSKFMAAQKKYKQSEKGKLVTKRRYLKYKEKFAEYNKQRVLSGKSAKYERQYRPKYIKARRANDQSFRLILNLRVRFKTFLRLKNLKKINSTMTLIGCSPEELRSHIEKQFKHGMSWDNYGLKGWHVDHIKPLSLAKSMQEIIDGDYMHYTNFQPLWAAENISKGKKYNNN